MLDLSGPELADDPCLSRNAATEGRALTAIEYERDARTSPEPLRLRLVARKLSAHLGDQAGARRLAVHASITRRSAFATSSPPSSSCLLGGIEALVMRLQLAGPDLHLLTPEQYDQLFTMHGMTMIFLYAAPVLSGFCNYLWPLLLGCARHGAARGSTRFSYWIYLRGRLFLYAELRHRRGAQRRLVQLRALCRARLQPRPQHRFLRAGHDLPRHLHHGRRRQLHRHAPAHCARRACRSTACRSWSGAR